MPDLPSPAEEPDKDDRSESNTKDDDFFWDELLTQDMAWSPARKAMRDAARRREREGGGKEELERE